MIFFSVFGLVIQKIVLPLCRDENYGRGSFACSYARYERLRRLLEERGARVEETLFGAEVEIVFSAPETQSESFVTLLRDATAGEAEVRLGESVFRPEREEE